MTSNYLKKIYSCFLTPAKSRHLWHLGKNKSIYIQFKKRIYNTCPVLLSPPSLSWHQTHHAGHAWVHITDSADQRNIFCCGTTLETRGKISRCIRVICWHTAQSFWLAWGMKSTTKRGCLFVCLCRRRTHAEMSHRLLHSWKLAGDLSGTQIKAAWSWCQLIPSYISIQIFQLEEIAKVSGRGDGFVVVVVVAVVSVSGEGVCLSSGATCARPFCAVVARYNMPECLLLDVHDSNACVCVPVCLKKKLHLTALCCVRGTDYRKALGFARGSFWFL